MPLSTIAIADSEMALSCLTRIKILYTSLLSIVEYLYQFAAASYPSFFWIWSSWYDSVSNDPRYGSAKGVSHEHDLKRLGAQVKLRR